MLNEFSANPRGLAWSGIFLPFFCWFSQLATGKVFAFFGTNGASTQSAVSNDDSMTMFAALMKAPPKKTETFLRRPESEVWNTIQKHSEGGPLLFPILPPVIRQRRSARTLLTKRKNLSAYDQQWSVSSAWKRTWGQINSNCQIFRSTTEVMYTTRFAW